MRPIALFLCLTLLAAACGDDGDTDAAPTTTATPGAVDGSSGAPSPTTTASSTSTAPTTTAGPEPLPAYDEPGPHAVGRRTTVIVDDARDGRSLPLEILYPAVDDSGTPNSDYELIAGLGYTSDRALDAPPPAVPAETAGFPLIVYSHGNGGFGWVHADLTEHLASHGFVVVAPDHVGNTLVESFLGTSADTAVVAAQRPLDVSFAITATLAGETEALADLAPLVDPERIGVVGHSFGGFTALAVAGGTEAAPADERVDAVVGLAPATGGLTDEGLAAVDVPTLLVSGTADITTPIEPNTQRPFDLVTGRPLTRIDIIDAGHMTFSDICRFVEILEELPDVSDEVLELADSYAVEACVPELIDIDLAQDIINHATTAFFLAEVAGDETAEAATTDAGIAGVGGDEALVLAPD